LWEELDDIPWLYRGVPLESPEVLDVRYNGEVRPPRLDRVGEYWQAVHLAGDTETGYTSWTTDRSIAEAAGEFCSDDYELSGRVVILKVRVETLSMERLFTGRADEYEYLIEGTVEDVSISGSADEEEGDHE
jgi:hypothetical protein